MDIILLEENLSSDFLNIKNCKFLRRQMLGEISFQTLYIRE